MRRGQPRLLGRSPMIPEVCAGPAEPGLVSVLIPSYNRAYIVASAIESVLAQTYPSVELVVVDDGSTDDTRTVVERYPNTRYIYQDNAGLAAARNTGLQAARGEFIAFLDSDDTWLPWKLAAQVAMMRRFPELVLTWTDMTAVNSAGEVVHESFVRKMYDVYQKIDVERHLPSNGRVGDVYRDCPPEIAEASFRHGEFFNAMFMGNLVHPPTAVMRRDAVHRTGGLDLTFGWTIEDYEFFWRLARQGPGGFLAASSMSYRVAAEDKLSKPSLHLFPAHAFLLLIQRHLTEAPALLTLSSRTIRHQLAFAHAWVGEEELLSENGLQRQAAVHLLRSVMLHPAQKRVLFLLPFSLVPKRLTTLARHLKQRIGRTISWLMALHAVFGLAEDSLAALSALALW
jgi:glycosyltransferase involved in cell wall biosynthesis